MNNCEHELSQLAVIDLEVQPISELANAAIIQVNETLTRLRNYASKIDIDPQRLLEVEERIGVIHRLVRKYKIEADEIPTFLQNLQIQLDELQNSDVQRDKIQQDIQNLQQEYCALANELSKKRRSAADRLNRQISEAMQTLGMPGGVFEVELEHLPTEQYQAFGMEKIQFLVSANPGMPAKALAKVASGGELSRISLAIQVCLSQHREMPTLIYDEIDVGIGGATAEIVGLQLRRLSRGRQVLSVTHLPQVAAQGHHQFRVKKKTLKGHTSTEMIELDAEQRVEEIARMLGGVKLTEQTLAHAREMLNTAKIDTKNEAVPSCAET